MIQTNYHAIPDKLFANYLNFLIAKVFKILPMKESADRTLETYLRSLQNELTGNIELIVSVKYDSNFLALLGNIEYLIHNRDISLKDYRRIVFNSISLINKVQAEYIKEE